MTERAPTAASALGPLASLPNLISILGDPQLEQCLHYLIHRLMEPSLQHHHHMYLSSQKSSNVSREIPFVVHAPPTSSS